jgi:membrane-associated phospholipid phosphatase
MLGALERDTGAFPSSHIAIAFIVLVTIWLERGRLRYLVAVLFAGLFMATVYGGPHYGIDLPAGLATGALFLSMPVKNSLLSVNAEKRKIETRNTQRGTGP